MCRTRVILRRGYHAGGIEIDDLEAIGHGIERPEQVLVDPRRCGLRLRQGVGGGTGARRRRRCTGWGMRGASRTASPLDDDGHFLIANFGLGALQDARSGHRSHSGPGARQRRRPVAPVDQLRPRRLVRRALGVGVLRERRPAAHASPTGRPTGTSSGSTAPPRLPRWWPTGSPFRTAWPSTATEEYLYVVRTLKADVVRFARRRRRARSGGTVQPAPGGRRDDEYGEHAAALIADRSVTRRWGMADGCAFDAAGNLWVTLARANRIVAVTPERQRRDDRRRSRGALLSGPTSVAWGGDGHARRLHRLAGDALHREGRSSMPGMPMVHQR